MYPRWDTRALATAAPCGTKARCTAEGTCEYVAPPDGGPGLPDGGAVPPDAGVAVPPDAGATRDATMLP